MNAKHCCVVNADGKYITLVLVLENAGVETVQYYTLKEGEFLVETCPPSEKPYAGMDGFIKPRWNGTEWVETATEDEISAWEAEHPAPSISDSEPTQLDRVEAQVTYTAMMTDTLLEV